MKEEWISIWRIQQKRRKNLAEKRNQEGKKGFVNVIARGYASGGLTDRSKKKYLYNLKHGLVAIMTTTRTCPTMTFKDTHRHIQTPLDDPLVANLKIAKVWVGRVLIDSRNSSDIMTMNCLKKLKFQAYNLEPISQPLVEFGGQSVHLLGSKTTSPNGRKRER